MYYIIYNPASKSGKGIKIWHKVKKIFLEEKKEFRVYRTSPERNATTIASCILDRSTEDRINLVVLGGDGTVHEALQAFKTEDFDRVRFHYIPTGSSNDLARGLGLSGDLEDNVRNMLRSGCHRNVDVGIITYNKAETLGYRRRYFLVSSGLGFDASVCREAMKSKTKDTLNKIGLGKLSYLAITLKQLYEVPNTRVTIIPESGEEISIDKCYFVASMNGCFQGGGLKFAPDARMDDGLIDICYAGGISKLRVLFSLPSLMKGKHIGKKGICLQRVKSARIVSQIPLDVHTDGEVKTKETDITVRLMSGKLKMVI